jgi:hypothetical protein
MPPDAGSRDLVGLQRNAGRKAGRGWIEPHGLLDDAARQLQVGQVGVGRRAPAQHFVELGVKLRLPLRLLRKRVPDESHGRGGGLVAGDEDGQHLVAHLLSGEGDAGLLVQRGDQPAKQIELAGIGPARLDQPHQRLIHRGEQLLHRPLATIHAHRADDRQEVEQVEGERLIQAPLQRQAGDAGHLAGVAGEHGARDDLQRQTRHVGRHFDLGVVLEVAPLVGKAGRRLDHRLGVAGDAARVERRGHDAPVLAPGLAVAGKQPLAEQGAEGALL